MASTPPTETGPSVRVEIFDQVYNLRGTDPAYILQLAEYVDSKMRAVRMLVMTLRSNFIFAVSSRWLCS